MDNLNKQIKPVELNLFSITTLTKNQLRLIIGYKRGKWSRELIILEPELKKISSTYSRLGSILTPKEVKFIITEFGFSEHEFIELANGKRMQSLE